MNDVRTAIEHEHWSFISPPQEKKLIPPKQISGYAPDLYLPKDALNITNEIAKLQQ